MATGADERGCAAEPQRLGSCDAQTLHEMLLLQSVYTLVRECLPALEAGRFSTLLWFFETRPTTVSTLLQQHHDLRAWRLRQAGFRRTGGGDREGCEPFLR